jgi:hypothetical protein
MSDYIDPVSKAWLKSAPTAVSALILAISGDYGNLTAAERAEAYVQLKAAIEDLDECLKPARAYYALMREKGVPEAFGEEGLSTLVLESGYRVTVSKVLRTSVREGKRMEAHAWLRANDLGDLIIETVNSSTLAAAARKLMEEGKDIPDAIFNAAIMLQVSATKVKK